VIGGIKELFWFVLVTGVLVGWHEWGHYWVGKKLGVKAVRYAIGFGKTLFSWHNAAGTEFAVKAVPLGGYVKFVNTLEGDVAEADRPFAFDMQPVWKRALIILAGPCANLLLTVVALAAMFMFGVADDRAVLGKVEGAARAAGLQRLDEITAINGQKIGNWTEALIELTQAGYDKATVQLSVRNVDSSSTPRSVALNLSKLPAGFDADQSVLTVLGIHIYADDVPAVIAATARGKGAEKAGILANDAVLAIDGIKTLSNREMVEVLQQQAALSAGKLLLSVRRAGNTLEIPVQAAFDAEAKAWRMGVELQQGSYQSKYSTTRKLSLFAAVPESARKTWYYFTRNLGMLKSLVMGQASARNVSGMLSISQAAKASAESGIAGFLNFLALVSLSLFIVNMLPIPVLDGGHLLYMAIETLKGSPPGEKMMVAGQIIGLTFIFSLMSLAMFNDITRRFGGP
jgi:regulator of sigma E protease